MYGCILCVYVCMYVSMHVHVYVCICLCVYAYVSTCMWIHVVCVWWGGEGVKGVCVGWDGM